LVCSASVGSGHGRAASAIVAALARLRPDAYVRHVDILSLTNPIFRRIYGKGYFDAIDLMPHAVKYFYDRLDRPTHADALCSLINRLNFPRFIRMLTEERWDLVINTHFLPPEMVSHLRRAGRVAYPQMTVTTDFDIHRLWVHAPCERYFTATEEGRINLSAFDIPLEQITASGIPIDPVFSDPKSAAECRQRHGIVGDRPVVLQLPGGQGFGPAERVHRAILKVQTPLEIVAVAGRNEAVRQRLQNIDCPSRHRRQVIGFTDQMDEYMAAADLIVSKPGGLTTSEALARGAAMTVIEPIPGQEERNCDFLLEQGAALKANNLASLSHKIASLIGDADRLQSLRAAAARAGKPMAAFDIARAGLALIGTDIRDGRSESRPPKLSRMSRIKRFSRLPFRRWRRTQPAEVKDSQGPS